MAILLASRRIGSAVHRRLIPEMFWDDSRKPEWARSNHGMNSMLDQRLWEIKNLELLLLVFAATKDALVITCRQYFTIKKLKKKQGE